MGKRGNGNEKLRMLATAADALVNTALQTRWHRRGLRCCGVATPTSSKATESPISPSSGVTRLTEAWAQEPHDRVRHATYEDHG
jgi:hypothetical protein